MPTITTTMTRTARGTGVQTIICSIAVHNPHRSSHVPGTVNVIARVDCTSPVSGISEAVLLYRDAALVSSQGANNNWAAALQVNTTGPCVNGSYLGTASALIFAPPGYTPPVANIVGASPVVPITC